MSKVQNLASLLNTQEVGSDASFNRGEIISPSEVATRLEKLELTREDLLHTLRPDRLRVGLHGTWRSDRAEQDMAELMGRAQAGLQNEHPLLGSPFELWTSAVRKRRYALGMSSEGGVEVLTVPLSRDNPPFLATFSGSWHLAYSPRHTETYVHRMAEELGFDVERVTLHALDLCSDLPVIFRRGDLRNYRGTIRNGGKHRLKPMPPKGEFTGFSSENLHERARAVRCYAKHIEARKRPSSAYLLNLWERAGIECGKPISRVELVLNERRALEQFGIYGFADLAPDKLREVWEWFTREYLILTNRKGNVTGRWEGVQSVSAVYSRNKECTAGKPAPFRVPRYEDVPLNPVYALMPTGETEEGKPKAHIVALDPREVKANAARLHCDPFSRADLADESRLDELVQFARTKEQAEKRTKRLQKMEKEKARAAAEVERPAVQHPAGPFRLFVPKVPDGVSQILASESDLARTLYALSRHHYPVLVTPKGLRYKGTIVMGWGSGSLASEVKKYAGQLTILDKAERRAKRWGESVQQVFDRWDTDTAFHLVWLRYILAYNLENEGRDDFASRVLDACEPFPFKLHYLTFLHREAMQSRVISWERWAEEGPCEIHADELRRDLAALYRLVGANHEQEAIQEARRIAAA